MRQAAGQAARAGVRHAGGSLVRLGRVLLATLLLVCLAVGGLAWRLSTGPIALPWLAAKLAAAASTPTRSVTIDGLAVSWGGFAHTDEPPLGLHVTGIAARSLAGELHVARADIVLALGPLLTGRIRPSTASISGVRLQLADLPDHAASAPPVDVAQLLRLIANPSSGPGRGWLELRHLHVHGVQVQAAGVPARLTGLDVDLDRAEPGGVVGRAGGVLQAAGQTATLALTAQLPADGHGTDLQASLTAVSPAALAGYGPEAAFLGALDAPVTLTGAASLGPDLAVRHAELVASVGAGTIHAGIGTAPLLAADVRLDYQGDRLEARLVRLDTAADPARRTRFTGQATILRANKGRADLGFEVSASLDVDRVAFADLPVLWPEGVGGKGARPWITENITAGEVRDGHVAVDLAVPPDLSDVSLRRIDAAIDGHDLTVHWLRPVPPLEHAEARMTVTDPDVIDIAVTSAVQAGGTQGGIAARDGAVHLTGIAGADQYADIRTGLAGKLPDLLAVLNHPRIKLLDKRPVPMRDPAGDFLAQLNVSHLPLRADVAMDDLAIQTTAHFSAVHLGGLIAGYDLSDGLLDLTANNDGLQITGTAALAGFPSRAKIDMDFRTGPSSQIQESATVHSDIDLSWLGTFGIPVGREVAGTAELQTVLEARRDGQTHIDLAADLTGAKLSEPRMGVDKAAGTPGHASARITLQGDHLAGIDRVQVSAPGIDVQGVAELAEGRPNVLRLDRLVLGRGTDAHGEIRLPAGGAPLSVTLTGRSLDLSPALHGTSDLGDRRGTPWRAELNVDRLVLAPPRAIESVRISAESDGETLTRAVLSGRAGQAFVAKIVPEPGGRRLTADAGDAGALVAAASGSDALIGGRLHVVGRWADGVAGRPLRGLAEMADFRIRDAPEIGRVLQGLTVYGLAELAQGPGVGFTKLVAPFTLTGRTLDLGASQAFSASLGMTAQGRLDLARRTADLNGTVVPAYFFNSLLGRVPLLGRLFTAEKGGGLFAAAVTVRGPLDDLSVHVNPLSALTPGILRGLFGTDEPPRK